jgi:hypothetical protein
MGAYLPDPITRAIRYMPRDTTNSEVLLAAFRNSQAIFESDLEQKYSCTGVDYSDMESLTPAEQIHRYGDWLNSCKIGDQIERGWP